MAQGEPAVGVGSGVDGVRTGANTSLTCVDARFAGTVDPPSADPNALENRDRLGTQVETGPGVGQVDQDPIDPQNRAPMQAKPEGKIAKIIDALSPHTPAVGASHASSQRLTPADTPVRS